MIPKIIHYCWFGGGQKSDLIERCIASWKKYCPDCKIMEWNESNYDVTKNPYMYQAYQAKRWGFVSDYARLDISLKLWLQFGIMKLRLYPVLAWM